MSWMPIVANKIIMQIETWPSWIRPPASHRPSLPVTLFVQLPFPQVPRRRLWGWDWPRPEALRGAAGLAPTQHSSPGVQTRVSTVPAKILFPPPQPRVPQWLKACWVSVRSPGFEVGFCCLVSLGF